MNPRLTLAVATATVLTGAAAFAAAYDMAAGPAARPTPSSRTASVSAEPAAATAPRPAVRVRWAPCPHGTHLVRAAGHHHGRCVREVVHVVPVAPSSAAAPATSSGSTDEQEPGRTDDDGARHPAGTPHAPEHATPPSPGGDDSEAGDHDDSGHDGEHDGSDDDRPGGDDTGPVDD